jgi:phage-related protein
MKNIPLALRQAKNSFGQDSPWLPLLELTLPAPDNTVFRIVPNNEDITFQGNVYSAFPIQIELPKESSTGEIQAVRLMVSNVTRTLQGHLEALNGGVGSTVRMIIVNTAHLVEDYAELTMDFDVLSVECNAQWVTCKLGIANPMRRKFPGFKYMAGHCNWQFKSAECAYAGSATECDRTLAACTAKNNATRFGGYPGLVPGGLRVA